MTRRWKPGPVRVGAFQFQVVKGRKHPDDLRLDMWAGNLAGPGVWVSVPMCLGAVLADFFYENEGIIYPPPMLGGRKYLDYVNVAATQGWQVADAGLRAERQARHG